MNHFKFNTASAALLLMLSAPFASQAQTPVISNAQANVARGYIAVAGANFSPTGAAPTVTVGGISSTVFSFTDTLVVVGVPLTLAAASYLVTAEHLHAVL